MNDQTIEVTYYLDVTVGNTGGDKQKLQFLSSNFRLVLNAVCFVLGHTPVYEFYMLTFRKTLSVFHLHRCFKQEIRDVSIRAQDLLL